MAVDLTKCVRLADSSIVRTAKGRLGYANLTKLTLMKGETDQEKARYSTSMLFNDKADLSELIKLVNETAVEKWGADYAKKFKVKKPFLKVEDFPKMSELVEKGFTIMIRVSSKTKPEIRLANKMPADESDVYSGRWALITVNAFTYDHPTGGKGVSLGLQNVQLLDHDDRLGGGRASADDQFENLGDSVDTDPFA